MTKPCMPMSGRNTDTAERSRSRWQIKCIKSITQTTSKKNIPRVLGIDKTMKRVKLGEDIIIKAQDTSDVFIRGRLCHGLYAIDVPPVHQVFSGVRVSSTHWHVRLGHPATPIVHHVLRRHDLLVVVSNKIVETVCDAYHQGNRHQLPFSESSHVVKTSPEIVYSDVWGHAQTSVSGHNYYVSFIDAYSQFTWLYLIKKKSEVFDVFIQFQAHVERLLKQKIIHVQSDWGGEYHNLNTFFNKLGISHCVSCPHTHQQNGTAERKHRHLVETGLTLLDHASVPPQPVS